MQYEFLLHYFTLLFAKNSTTTLCSAGFGLACHIGVLADLPTVGVGKNVSLNFFIHLLKI